MKLTKIKTLKIDKFLNDCYIKTSVKQSFELKNKKEDL